MSISGALFAGVSGLKAESSTLGVISNNISNTNTVGYKAGSGDFSTLVTNTNGSSDFSPGGVLAKPVQNIDQQGLLQATSSNTDVGITGRGFFVVANQLTSTGQIASTTPRDFTRAGSFSLDKSGNLVNSSGFFLLGVPTDTKGNPVTANPIVDNLQPVNIGTLTGIAKGTTTLSMGANLPAVPSAPSHLKVSGTLDGTNSFQDPAHYVLTGSTGEQYDAQIYYNRTSATTYDIQLLNITPIGNSSPVDTSKSTMPVTIGTATLTASGATLAGGTAVSFQDKSTLQPVLDVSGLKQGSVNAVDRAAVDAQDVTSTVYDSLGVAHNLTLEFQRGSDLNRAAPSNIKNNTTLSVTLNNAAANTQQDPTTYILYSAQGFAYQAKLAYSVPITPATVVTVSATDIEPLPGSNSPPVPTALATAINTAPGAALGTIDTAAGGAVLTNPALTLQGGDTLTLNLGATQTGVTLGVGATVNTIGPNTETLSQTVAVAGQNKWITSVRNMTIASTGAPSVVFPAGAASTFPIYLDGTPGAALGKITPPGTGIQFNVSGSISTTAAAASVTQLGVQRIIAQDGNAYDATMQFTLTTAGAAPVGNVQITALKAVGNAPTATVGLPVTVGQLSFLAGGSTFSNGASPVTVVGTTQFKFNNPGILSHVTSTAGATSLSVAVDLGTSTAPPASAVTSFNADGTLAAGAPNTIPALTMATGASPFGGSTFSLNLGTANTAGGMTQFTDQFAISFLNQDGVRFGFRTGVSFGTDGLVSAVFDNGQQIPLFKVPLVNFANVNELQAISGDSFGQTTESGDPVPNFPGVGGTGQLTPSTLESSTVDLSTEFANLIITQRSFSADAKTITTADQMLQQLLEIKQ